MFKTRTLLLSFFIAILFAVPALADEAFDIQSFKTDIQINKDSTINVIEGIDVNFTQNRHGIYRDIQNTGIDIKVSDVTDNGGNEYQYAEETFSEGIRLKIGDPNVYVIGKKTYNISYKVKKAIRFFPTHDELYWNATGTEWPAQIKQAVATVKLPKEAEGKKLQLKCYTGYFGYNGEDCTYKYDTIKNEVIFKSNYILSSYNGMTVVVGFPKGVLKPPATLEVKSKPNGAKVYLNGEYICKTNCNEDSLYPGIYNIGLAKFGYKPVESKTVQLASGKSTMQSFILEPYLWFYLLEFLLILLALIVALEPIYTFWEKGRDPKGKGSIMPQYDPPDNLSPSEVGTLVDENANLKDITSIIVDLAVRGYLIIKVLPDAKGFIFKKDDYELIKIENPQPKGKRELTSFEINFMKKVFGNNKSKKVSDLEDKFYKHLSGLKETLYNNLVKKEYFPKSPNAIRSKYIIKGVLFTIFGFFLTILELILFGNIFAISIIINGILSFIFANFMPKKTEKGVLAYEHILGFKHYMEIAEKDRLKFQEKENIFYEILPYAMTLGVADKWSKAFKDIFKEPPDWYQGVGGGHFYPIDFTHNIQSMSSSLNTAFSSSTSNSSGGSGFSGGSSGGGSGGGGGGSW